MMQFPSPTLTSITMLRALADRGSDLRLYPYPAGLSAGVEAEAAIEAGTALRLAGTWIAFSRIILILRDDEGVETADLPVTTFRNVLAAFPYDARRRGEALLGGLERDAASWSGLDLAEPVLMGIVNVTPDSFSDGGATLDPAAALAAADRLRGEGARILDIGAESTRPDSEPVDEETERERLKPLLRRLAKGRRGVRLSIDTRKASIMRAAIEAGFGIVNDISALTDDPDAMAAVEEMDACAVLTHRQGEPRTMNDAPAYDHVLLDVFDALEMRIKACESAGIPRASIAIDPGIGFGKRGPENRALLRGLPLFHALGCPLVIGLSRKSFSQAMEDRYPPADRLPATLASLTIALAGGAQILRVHDVAAVKQAVEAWMTIVQDREGERLPASVTLGRRANPR